MKAQNRQSEPTDAELIAHGEMDPLVNRWWPLIRRWALMDLGDRALAEDASQEAVVRILRLGHTYRADRPFRGWLRTLVRNCGRDVRRRQLLRSPEPVATPTWPTVDRSIDFGRSADLALRCFARLPAEQREVLDLCHHQGLTPTQAADRMGVTAGNARVLLHRARRSLRRALAAHRDELLDLLRES